MFTSVYVTPSWERGCSSSHFYSSLEGTTFLVHCLLPAPLFWDISLSVQVRDDLVVMGCRAMLDKYDSYSVKVNPPDGCALTTITWLRSDSGSLCPTGVSGEGGKPEPRSSEDDRRHSERKQPLLHVTGGDALHTVRHQRQDRVSEGVVLAAREGGGGQFLAGEITCEVLRYRLRLFFPVDTLK